MRSFIAALSLSILAVASVQADDPYTVDDVAIDASADNALEAQTAAMRQGQEDAARVLIERLTLQEDRTGTAFDFEPHMNEFGEMVTSSELDQTIVAEMISGLEIQNEQRSSTRYLAELNISFDPRAVERVFAAYDIPYVSAQSRPTLVLPILDGATDFQLWENNPWRAAWTSQSFANSLTPMFVPRTMEGASLISARDALSLNEEALRAAGAYYGGNRIAVLRAQERGGIRRFGGYLVNLDNAEELTVETWGPQSVFGGWSNAAQQFVFDRETEWKRQSVVRDGETQEFRVTVLYGGLNEWRSLQSALTGTSLVEDARLDAMSRDGALMTVNYRGALEQLVSELAERGATLEEYPDLGWVVRTEF